jgi:hypothetical protein
MASPTRPGVEIIQELQGTPAVTAAPTLVPMIVGVCNQIIEALDSEGSLDESAKFAGEQYNQSSVLVTQGQFPDPRGNIDELNVYEETIQAFLFFGGTLLSLSRGSNGSFGSSFLKAMNLAKKAVIRSTEADSFVFDAVVGDPLTLAFNVANPVDTSSDVVITLLGTLSTEEVVDEVNSGVGKDVAFVFEDTAGDFGPVGAKYLELSSDIFGAASSVTLRAGTGSLKKFFGAGFDDSKEYRVEGAGFRGQDDEDNDLFTPWIEFFQGSYLVDGVDTSFPADNTSDDLWPGLTDLDLEFVNAKAGAIVFSGPSASLPLVASTVNSPGDQFWADGVQVGDAEIIKLEPTRFKLGRLNTSLSVFNDDGVPTTRVYDTIEVNIIFHSNAFAPKNAYFVADGLIWPDIVPEGLPATLTATPPGSVAVTAEREGVIQSSTDVSFPVNLASLTMDWQLTEDGIDAPAETYTFVGGPFVNIGDLVTALTGELDGVTVSNSGDRLVLSTTKTGADQKISVKSTGTANPALGFSTVSATADAGKDTEYIELAEATGELISLPLVGQTTASLHLTVSDSKGAHDITVSPVDLSSAATMGDLVDAVAVAFGGTAVTDRTLYDGGIAVATVESNDDAAAFGTLTIKSLEGGATVTIALEATDGADGWRHLGFYDAVGGVWAEVSSTTPPTTLPVAGLDGTALTFTYDDGTGPYSQTQASVAGADGAATMVALAAVLNADVALTDQGGSRVLWFVGDDTAAAERLIVRTVLGGATASLDGTAAAGNVNASVDVGAAETSVGAASLGNSDDAGDDTLKSTELGFFLDDNPFLFLASFTTNSLQDAIDEINEEVSGATDVASEDAGALVLTSLLPGSASSIEIDETTSAAAVLGISGDAVGSGRPNPDFFLDGTGSAIIGASILRNGTTGQPFSLESAIADIYLQYSALRIDVSAMAEDPNTLTFGEIALMEEAIGPISTANPLALGTFLALQNAPAVDVSALGLDERNDAAPEGTIDAWARALELLESKEVYTLAPLTGDGFINQLISTHTKTMSLPTNRGERICFIWSKNPVTAPDTTVISGVDAEANGTNNSMTLETNPSTDLIALGFDLSGPIPLDENLYIEVLVVDNGITDLRKYSIAEVNGVLVNLRVTFSEGENIDGFYSTTPFDGGSGFIGLDWTMLVRGDALLVKGTTRLDLGAVSEAAAEQAVPFASRRVYYLFCDAVDTSVNGITQKVPGYYVSAAIAGMVAQLSPQQPFTRVPVTGFNRVYGTDDLFSENQMDTIADGGRYIMVNQAGAIISRHSRSTNTLTIEERELSITKSIDWLAKGLRDTNRVFIGRFVINQGFLDQLTMANQGFLMYAVQLGVVAKAALKNILQSTDEPDTILIDVEALPQYPCNKIRVTIVA